MSAAEAQTEIGRTLALGPARLPAEHSNRRLTARGVATPIEHRRVPEPVFKEVGAACEYALTLWPNAKAAILFGSRARGDHRADSDWDVAFVTQKDESLPNSVSRVFESLRKRSKIDVQALAISQVRLCACADSLGKIAAPIAREGRLIAGGCEWPETESEPILKPVEYSGWRSGALRRIASASKNLSMAIDLARTDNVQSELGDFVAASSDAAERLAKIAFGKLTSGTGIAVPKRHQINEIVEILDRAMERNGGPNREWWRSDRGKKFRELLNMMNGHGHKDHQFGYFDSKLGAHDIDRGAQRLLATVSFAILEAEELPGPGDLRQAARVLAGNYWNSILDEAGLLRKSLQNIDPNNLTYSTADSDLVESVSVAASFGEEIAQALEKLADSLHAESENRSEMQDP